MQTSLNFEEEVWLPLNGYEGLYEVSSMGRIKYLLSRSERINIRSGFRWGDMGYLGIELYKDKKRKKALIHRLVAIAFIPNPENKPWVNHIDSDRANNRVSNLEWCTPLENYEHAVKNKRMLKPPRKVKVTNLKTGEINIFRSITYACEQLNVTCAPWICTTLINNNGKKNVCGYFWELIPLGQKTI